jgi:hypothetical protein
LPCAERELAVERRHAIASERKGCIQIIAAARIDYLLRWQL